MASTSSDTMTTTTGSPITKPVSASPKLQQAASSEDQKPAPTSTAAVSTYQSDPNKPPHANSNTGQDDNTVAATSPEVLVGTCELCRLSFLRNIIRQISLPDPDEITSDIRKNFCFWDNNRYEIPIKLHCGHIVGADFFWEVLSGSGTLSRNACPQCKAPLYDEEAAEKEDCENNLALEEHKAESSTEVSKSKTHTISSMLVSWLKAPCFLSDDQPAVQCTRGDAIAVFIIENLTLLVLLSSWLSIDPNVQVTVQAVINAVFRGCIILCLGVIIHTMMCLFKSL